MHAFLPSTTAHSILIRGVEIGEPGALPPPPPPPLVTRPLHFESYFDFLVHDGIYSRNTAFNYYDGKL